MCLSPRVRVACRRCCISVRSPCFWFLALILQQRRDDRWDVAGGPCRGSRSQSGGQVGAGQGPCRVGGGRVTLPARCWFGDLGTEGNARSFSLRRRARGRGLGRRRDEVEPAISTNVWPASRTAARRSGRFCCRRGCWLWLGGRKGGTDIVCAGRRGGKCAPGPLAAIIGNSHVGRRLIGFGLLTTSKGREEIPP